VIIELGHFALILALIVSVLQMVLPAYGAHRANASLTAIAAPASIVQFLLVAAAFFALMVAYVSSDFSVENVWANSHSAKPLLYKIAGVWGNHEGSMLLWVLILALFGAAVGIFGSNLPPLFRARVLSVQGSLSVTFISFILFTSNPFARLVPAAAEGQGLNPILQDPALAFHPPFLYTGYVGFSMAFSFAVAALWEGRIDAAWARWVRPWTLLAWIALTIGIAMGSWWAYYTLGWGGWWFWDPVENASFMPWLAGTALLHSAVVMEKREALKIWTVLLAILTFSLSLMGTFLVRSGILTSVHAFAVDPRRGVVILGILAVFIGGALMLYAWRASTLKAGGLFQPISREGALVVNNVLLSTATATVLIGTLYPLGLEAVTGAKISVGAPYFDMTFVPLMIPLLMAMPAGALLAWKRGDLIAVLQRLRAVLLGSLLIGALALALTRRGPWLAPLAIALGAWVVLGAFSEWAARIKAFVVPVDEAYRRARNLPRSAYGMLFAHAGVGICVIGITATTAWHSETVQALSPGQKLAISGYELTFNGAVPGRGPNYHETIGRFTVSKAGRTVTTLMPSKRIFDVPRQATTQAAILNAVAGDLYVVLGDSQPDGGFVVRAYFHPLVRLIWLGALIMAFGGLLSISDRRLRLGAARPARRQVPLSPAAAE
jgi:cytochrome c-type biogenesis protein CcmF